LFLVVVLDFPDRKPDLGTDRGDPDEEGWIQNQRHGEVRRDYPRIDEAIMKLESSFSLSEKESRRPVIEVARLFKNEGDGKWENVSAPAVVSSGRGRLQSPFPI
jgi:hypothetical protein